MQRMKIQAENDVEIPVSGYLYEAVYYMKDTDDNAAQKKEAASELAKKWDGSWTNGYENGSWQYYLSTEEYLKDDPLLETEFWKQWGAIFQHIVR